MVPATLVPCCTVDKINFILSDTPESQAWKAQKLRELSIINGTFRDMPNFGPNFNPGAPQPGKQQEGLFSKDVEEVLCFWCPMWLPSWVSQWRLYNPSSGPG